MPEKQENTLSVLAIGEFSADRLLLHDICHQSGWRLIEARDRRHAMKVLERKSIQVVIAESELPNWNWKNVLSDLRRLAQPPAVDRHVPNRRRLFVGGGVEYRRLRCAAATARARRSRARRRGRPQAIPPCPTSRPERTRPALLSPSPASRSEFALRLHS